MDRSERFPSRYKPYLWVVGDSVETYTIDELVHNRYRVMAPCLWLDTLPQQRPASPDSLPPEATPYLKAHPHRLHLPGLYGILSRPVAAPILLLDNVPIHPQSGELLPSVADSWDQTSVVRQLYWLWQMWELWPVLQSLKVATSLLDPGNLRVEGWRLRLRQLDLDTLSPSLGDLAQQWQYLVDSEATPLAVKQPLQAILTQMADPAADLAVIEVSLNQLLLKQASQLSTRLGLAGATTAGPQQSRNEDACHPNGVIPIDPSGATPQVAIVCDGVGGHDGGDVASQLAVQSLRLQLQTLLVEVEKESQALPPAVVMRQLEAVIRIVNQLINFQNDNQARVERHRMGTTLVMAVVMPQSVQTDQGWQRVQEVYLAQVGDSRAYWITPDYCQLLTVDDDIAGREVKACRQLYGLAQERTDAGALTQAIGTRGEDYLQPHIQRLILDETGILLLCSDGLSDNYRIEDAWANYIGLIVKDIVTLESAVASWLELANQKNGHDNASVVLMQCKVIGKATPHPEGAESESPPPDPRRGQRAVLYGETPETEDLVSEPGAASQPAGLPLWPILLSAGVMVAGLLGWWWLNRLPPSPPTPTNPSTETTPGEP